MAAKKKSKKKQKTTKAKVTLAKKRTQKGTPKKSSKKTLAPSKASGVRKISKQSVGKASSPEKRVTRKKGRARDRAAFSPETSETTSEKLSGDLQGLSNVEDVDSESVDELVEEGNAFEPGVVSGVEDSGERGVKEVRTREVPEDDVPEEYLDKE